VKRSAERAELSREHQHALSLALRAKRAAQADAQTIAASAARCVADFEAKLAPHFDIEERVLLPALHAAGEPELVEQALFEHAAIRRLATALATPDAALLAEFGQLLGDHVRFEERVLFETAERRLSAQALAEVAAACRKG
jgi:hemerythrin-like domain-containing protein